MYGYQQQQPPRQYTQYNAPPQPQYGYGGQPAYGPPAGADPQLWQCFASVDTDRSGSITVTELQTALVNGAQAMLALSFSFSDLMRCCRQLDE